MTDEFNIIKDNFVEKYSIEINKLSILELLCLVNYIIYGEKGGKTSQEILDQENISNIVNDLLNIDGFRFPEQFYQKMCLEFIENYFKKYPEKEKEFLDLHIEYKSFPQGIFNREEYQKYLNRQK